MLTLEQLEEILNYSAFKTYNEEQKKILRAQLSEYHLSYQQILVLFSDDTIGGIVHNLVEDSKSDDSAAKQLGKILLNEKESINPSLGYPPTPILKNIIGRT